MTNWLPGINVGILRSGLVASQCRQPTQSGAQRKTLFRKVYLSAQRGANVWIFRPPARTQIPSCFASELSFRLPCSSLTRQAQKEFGAPCRVERACNSWPLSLSHSPASDFYSTWLIRCRAGPHTYFF